MGVSPWKDFIDEAIYLDWGWRMTHEPGYLYYSLYDGKQPLLMWLFGISESIFSDPLFAGRFVSVLFGFLAMYGIYKIGKTYFDTRVACIASFLYILIPIFSFYDRQALMEASLGTVGIWSAWYLLRIVDKRQIKDAIKLGVILGIGFLIKTTALVFFLTAVFLLLFFIFRKVSVSFKHLGVVLGSFFLTTILLLINPQFWETLSMNSRYGFTFSELIRFPILSWGVNIISDVEIMMFYVTPFVLLAGVGGLILQYKKPNKREQKILLMWVVVTLLFQIVLVKGVIPRYVVSFLPLLTIFSAAFLVFLLQKNKTLGVSLLLLTMSLPLMITLVQILHPVLYIGSYDKLTRFSEISYINGHTSGYGMSELTSFIDTLQKKESQQIFVGIASNAGIPESALNAYYQKNPDVTITYFDASLFQGALDTYDCLVVDAPVYFVSRERQTPGIEKFLIHLTDITNQVNDTRFGVWKLNTECEGEILELTLEKT